MLLGKFQRLQDSLCFLSSINDFWFLFLSYIENKCGKSRIAYSIKNCWVNQKKLHEQGVFILIALCTY